MISIEHFEAPLGTALSKEMHAQRKHVFHDIMQWDVALTGEGGRYEVDQFDTAHALYFMRAEEGRLLGSFRLLPSERPHMLADVFAYLCDGEIPTGPDVWEITRACVTPDRRAIERLRIRNELISSCVDFALTNGIGTYTAVVSAGWLAQVLAMGWEVEPLGLPRHIDGVLTAALAITIDQSTPKRLMLNGIYRPTTLQFADMAAAA